MPLESANNISQLDDRYPLASDPASRGDDHLRTIKSVLKKQFPGKDGNGFNTPITLTEEFLNGLPAALAKIKTDSDARWPIGSALLLFNNVNPNTNAVYPGTWALVTGDASLALGDGSNSVGSISGNNNPLVPVPLHGHNANFVGNQLPDHQHAGVPARTRVQVGGNTNTLYSVYADGVTSPATAGTPSGTVNIQNSGTENATLDVRGARIKVNVWKRTA